MEVAANASLSKSLSYRIYENGKALKDLTDNHGVILEDTPADYFTEYMAAAKKSLEAASAENEFFAEVWQSQKDFADIAFPVLGRCPDLKRKFGSCTRCNAEVKAPLVARPERASLRFSCRKPSH